MKAVFVDRDGTLIKDIGYPHRSEDFNMLPSTSKAIKKLNEGRYLVIVVTNQSGVARGYFSEKEMKKFNAYLISEFRKKGARIDAIYCCPHHKNAKIKKYRKDCVCRKPKPGMLLRAAREHRIDLKESWMVGDKKSDVLAGKAAGCKTIFIGARSLGADEVAKDLKQAAKHILRKR